MLGSVNQYFPFTWYKVGLALVNKRFTDTDSLRNPSPRRVDRSPNQCLEGLPEGSHSQEARFMSSEWFS